MVEREVRERFLAERAEEHRLFGRSEFKPEDVISPENRRRLLLEAVASDSVNRERAIGAMKQLGHREPGPFSALDDMVERSARSGCRASQEGRVCGCQFIYPCWEKR